MMKKFGIGAIALAAIAVMGLWSVAPKSAQAEETTTAATPAIEIKDYGIGPIDAKVKIIEYASFTCPHCANFHEQSFKKLKAEFIDTGKVRFEYREVYFDRYGLWAAMMARCGGEMRYFGISDILFSTQQDWAASEDPAVIVANLKKIGRTAGMDDTMLDACMKDATTAQAMMTHYETNFAADGIEGTPTFIINGNKHSNMDYADLKAIIDAELAK
jgi:protein-disulfide isomerase